MFDSGAGAPGGGGAGAPGGDDEGRAVDGGPSGSRAPAGSPAPDGAGLDAAGLAGCSDDALEHALGQLVALERHVHRLALAVIAEVDRRALHAADGARDTASWLAQRTGIDHRTAVDQVRVADALDDLPALASAYAEGVLSWDQLRPASRLATATSDAAVAASAPHESPTRLRRQAARHHRRRQRTVPPTPEVHLAWSGDALRLRGTLTGLDAAEVAATLGAHTAALPPDPATGRPLPRAHAQALALVDLLTAADRPDAGAADGPPPPPTGEPSSTDEPPATGPTAPPSGRRRPRRRRRLTRPTLVVHTPVRALLTGTDGAEVQHGPTLIGAELDRAACDGRIQVVLTGHQGRPVEVGRTKRVVPPWLDRLVRHRDGHCRFPGCDRTERTQAHHLVLWTAGGPTDLPNLALLCPFHHRLVHEGGWRLTGDPDHHLTATGPAGQRHAGASTPLRPDVAHRARRAVPAPVRLVGPAVASGPGGDP